VPYRIDIRQSSDAAPDLLIDLGALDVELSGDGTIAALVPDNVAVAEIATALHVPLACISTSAAAPRDSSVWLLSPRPVRLGTRELHLVDSDAFGTGFHPTTALCLERLSEIVTSFRPQAVLDVGTGSGVLAIAALMLGVPRALAIDIEKDALITALENAANNGVCDRLDVSHGGLETVAGSWPLVVANILAAPLIEMAPALVRRVAHDGRVILCGIPSALEHGVSDAYCDLGMRCVQRNVRDGWIALVLQASW
jgi:ribosomal protein L11 methylase PrmA